MHIVETYALNCGLKIDEPFIYEKYCPIPFDKFISFQPCSKYDSKSYDFWQEVINQILPSLQKQNIHIIQIGAKDERPLENCYQLQGKTTINQAAYVIKRSLLHFGADSFGVHVASHYDKPIVALYSNSRPENAGPYFNKSKNFRLLEINKENRKPSYSAQEDPKTINEIDPIDVANNILELLNLQKINIKTVYIGKEYNRKLIESIPNSIIDDIKKLGITSLIVRMDHDHNEQALEEQLKRNNCSIITKKPINFNILNKYKNNIAQIIYEIDEDNDIEFVKNLKRIARPFVLITYKSQDFVNSIKLKYMDYGYISKIEKVTKDSIKELEGKDVSKLFYKSNKFTVSLGKIYNSKAAETSDVIYENKPIKVIDTPEFWEESKYFYIFELTE